MRKRERSGKKSVIYSHSAGHDHYDKNRDAGACVGGEDMQIKWTASELEVKSNKVV